MDGSFGRGIGEAMVGGLIAVVVGAFALGVALAFAVPALFHYLGAHLHWT